eukprot:6192027-Pleurochrysis_carterae.AAC.2
MRSKEFLDLECGLRAIDFTSAHQQIDALDMASGANSFLVTRFFVAPSADLRGRHFVFNQLQLCMPEMLTATRAAHPEAGRYLWHAPALKALFKGKFSEIDGLNSPSGALALNAIWRASATSMWLTPKCTRWRLPSTRLRHSARAPLQRSATLHLLRPASPLPTWSPCKRNLWPSRPR